MKLPIKQLITVSVILMLFASSPIWGMMVGAYLQELLKGTPCTNEGNCVWAVLPWYLPFTILLSLIAFIAYGVYLLLSYLLLKPRQTSSTQQKNNKS